MWSEEGISSSFKFIQKLWNLNTRFTEEIEKNHKEDTDNEIIKYTNKFLKKVNENLESFSYNKIIANLHEMYSFMIKQINKKYKKDTLKENYKKILISIQPVIPHFSNECLELIGEKNIKWPDIDENIIREETFIVVVQINGKKRGLIETDSDKTEKELLDEIKKDNKLLKYFDNKEIKKTIYIKNKLINIII